MTFRLQGTCFLLTYSQVEHNDDNTPDALLQDILPLLELYGTVQHCRLAIERHSDGGTHYHVLVTYNDRIDRRLGRQ